MQKQHRIKLLSLFIFAFSAWTNFCYAAFEILPSSWPQLPLTPALTDDSTLINYIVYYFAFGMYIAGVLALISLAFAGVQFILSAESPENRNLAIGRIKGSALGLIILAGSFLIMGTINPKLHEVTVEPLSPLQGLQLVKIIDSSITTAPRQVSDLTNIKKIYNAIKWPLSIQDTDGTTIQNCDPAKHEIYVIYWFRDKNLKNFGQMDRVKCGDSIPLGWAKSYIAEKEQPGVYLYKSPNCTLSNGDTSGSLPGYYTQDIEEWKSGKIKSIRIVNGSDPLKGPFFGLINFTAPDYKSTDGFTHFKFEINTNSAHIADGYSRCINSPSLSGGNPTSFLIYKWAGYKLDPANPNNKIFSSDTGVQLFSKSSWTGGYNSIREGKTTFAPRDVNSGGIWYLNLYETPIYYPQDLKVPLEERTLCNYFDPAKKVPCLQSFKIDGNFLVIVSQNEDSHLNIDSTVSGRAQAFPISPRLALQYKGTLPIPREFSIGKGTPELASDFIHSENARYMEIIPLDKQSE